MCDAVHGVCLRSNYSTPAFLKINPRGQSVPPTASCKCSNVEDKSGPLLVMRDSNRPTVNKMWGVVAETAFSSSAITARSSHRYVVRIHLLYHSLIHSLTNAHLSYPLRAINTITHNISNKRREIGTPTPGVFGFHGIRLLFYSTFALHLLLT